GLRGWSAWVELVVDDERQEGAHTMLDGGELALFQQRAQAGLLRIADGERLLAALLSALTVFQDAEHELRALRAGDQDSQAISAAQRAEISKLRATIGSLRKELREVHLRLQPHT